MTDEADITLKRLDAINGWLEDVFGKDMRLSRLLQDAGMNEAEIEALTTAHLTGLITAIVNLIQGATDIPDREKFLMLRYYGLLNGEREEFHVIAHSVGVNRERIKQLVHRGLDRYRQPERKTQFIAETGTIAKTLFRN